MVCALYSQICLLNVVRPKIPDESPIACISAGLLGNALVNRREYEAPAGPIGQFGNR